MISFIFHKILVPLHIFFWFFPVVLLEISNIIMNSRYDFLSFAQLLIAFLFNYLYFNLRRDRIDLEKSHDIVNYIEKYKKSKFTLIKTADYIGQTTFDYFRSTYHTTKVTRLVHSKIDKFLDRIKIFLIEPDLENKGRIILPDGLKVFPSFITHETVLFLIDKPNKLNPVKKFHIFHELSHTHPDAMLPILLQEFNIIPFFWVLIWSLFTSSWTFTFFFFLGIMLLFIYFSDIVFSTRFYFNKVRQKAEISADYFGLRLLSQDERKNPIFRKMPLLDPNLDEESNKIRNENFIRLLDNFEQNPYYKMEPLFAVPWPVLICLAITISLAYFKIDTSLNSIKIEIGLLAILMFERLTNHRKILLLKKQINELTKCEFLK